MYDTAVHAIWSSMFELVNQLYNELAAGKSAAIFLEYGPSHPRLLRGSSYLHIALVSGL